VTEGEIIGCRRCPVAYHKECLPLSLVVTRNRAFGKRVWISGVDEEGDRKLDENGAPPPPSGGPAPTSADLSALHHGAQSDVVCCLGLVKRVGCGWAAAKRLPRH